MVQVKKAEVRESILEAAYGLFLAKGYAATSIAEIGRAAGVAPSGIYVYFKSKLELFYAVYEPWMKDRLIQLEREVAGMSGHREKVHRIIEAIWLDIPEEYNHFANNLMQAVSAATRGDFYSGDLLEWCMSRVAAMLRASVPPARRSDVDFDGLAHVVFMAFDGFAVRSYLGVRSKKMPAAIDSIGDLILGVESSLKLVPAAE